MRRAHPRLAEAWRARGLAWRDLARPGSGVRATRLARAERDFASAVRLRPNWAEAWADLGWTRFARGEAIQPASFTLELPQAA